MSIERAEILPVRLFSLGPRRVNSNTSGCSVPVPCISAFEMEMLPKIRAGDAFRISAASVVTASSGRPASTTDATRATLLFHNSLRHVSMAPSWVSRSLSLSLSLSPLVPALVEHVHVLLCYGIPEFSEGADFLGRQKYRITSGIVSWNTKMEEKGVRGRSEGRREGRYQDGFPLSRIIDPKGYRGPDTSSSVHGEGSGPGGCFNCISSTV